MSKKSNHKSDSTTEEKIKQAARKVFMQKGYAASRTRDIAEEAGINLALLNYYFRSKEKLFHLVMMETVQHFVHSISHIVNDAGTSAEQKLGSIVEKYIDHLISEPNFPFFILSEIQANPEKLLREAGIKELVLKSVFVKQLEERFRQMKLNVSPVHYLMNFAGLTVFPFAAKPMLKAIGNLNEKEFILLMQERKKLIPQWVHMMLASKT